MTNEEISREMGVGLRSVKVYLSEIFSKLGVGSRIEVITSCLQNGILSLEDLAQR
jgi:DNA-binding NarL/FixJ family response regulator